MKDTEFPLVIARYTVDKLTQAVVTKIVCVPEGQGGKEDILGTFVANGKEDVAPLEARLSAWRKRILEA